jgi:hypothetical protein
MLNGSPDAKPSTVRLTTRRKRGRAATGGGGRKREFVHAFADALRDILRDERRRAA